MGNEFVTRHYHLQLPESLPDNKSAEMPANRPNVAKYQPGDKAKAGKPKTLKHHKWTSRKRKRGRSV